MEIMSLPSPSYWLVRLLSIKDQVSLAMEQDFLLTQVRLAYLENFRAMANLPEAIEENSERSAPVRHWRTQKEGRDSGNIP